MFRSRFAHCPAITRARVGLGCSPASCNTGCAPGDYEIEFTLTCTVLGCSPQCPSSCTRTTNKPFFMATAHQPSTPRADSLSVLDRVPDPASSLAPTTGPILAAKSRPPAYHSPGIIRASLSPKAAHRGLSPRNSPQPLTGAAALADARRAKQQEEVQATDRQVSPNPKALALSALMGNQEMSKPSDAPATAQLSEPLQAAAEKFILPVTNGQTVHRPRLNGAGPQSTPNRGSSAMTATASPMQSGAELVEEPESIDEAGPNGDHEDEDDRRRPFTYPGPRSSQETPTRQDLSMSGSGSYDSGTKSTKRHKCPYCSTDFTRHHNLKSHLLTHSQEKPYVCQTCQARFRRLHDLKRHTKLHTGERPHTCPKCGRKFARGDALARHNKGPGGCANRKSSFGQDDGDDGGDDTMDGMEYENDQGDERVDESELLDAGARRISEPNNRKRPHPDSASQDRVPNRQHSSTYPPPLMGRIMRQEATAPMGPPQTLLSPSSKASPEHHGVAQQQHHEPQYTSQYYPQPHGSSASYPAPMVTESPRPLSPRGGDHHRLSVSDPQGLRNRSPSLTSNYQSPHYSSRSSGQSLPVQPHMTSHAPQLPSLPSMTAGHHAVQPPALVGPPTFPPHHSQHGGAATTLSGSAGGSLSSHGHSSSGSMRDILASDPQDLYAYVRNLEARFSRMQDEYELRISRLQADVIELKTQVYQGR